MEQIEAGSLVGIRNWMMDAGVIPEGDKPSPKIPIMFVTDCICDAGTDVLWKCMYFCEKSNRFRKVWLPGSVLKVLGHLTLDSETEEEGKDNG